MKLSLAVIGTGYFSQFQCKAWQRVDEVERAAICSLEKEVASDYAEKYGFSESYTDVDAMIAEVKPDVVDVITPPVTHLELIRKLAEAGIDIICQKPFCRNFEEALEAVQLAEAANVKLIIHENFRFQPWYQKINELLQSNTLGSIYQAQFNLRPGDGRGEEAYLGRQPYFRQMPKLLIHETAIHFIDVFRYLFGDINTVWASLRKLNPVIQGEDAGIVIMHNNQGVQLVFDGNRLSSHVAKDSRKTMGEMLIEGEKGCLVLDGDGSIRLRFHESQKWQDVDYEWYDNDFGGDCVFQTQRAALNGILGLSPVVNSGKDYINNILIEEAIYLSHEKKRQIIL